MAEFDGELFIEVFKGGSPLVRSIIVTDGDDLLELGEVSVWQSGDDLYLADTSGNSVMLYKLRGFMDGPNLVGDTNGDGVVNVDDLNAVRNNFGAGDGTVVTGIPGDAFPFDGFVDVDDLNSVRNNFGAGGAPVPEPSALFLMMTAAGLGWTRPRVHRDVRA